MKTTTKNLLLSILGVFFLFSTSIVLTFLFLFFLPTHTTHELVSEHEAIMYSVLPFTNQDIGFLSADEQSHMRDVARLGLLFIITAIISGLLCVRYGFHKVLHASGFFLISIFFLSTLFFRQFWNWFHYVFFPQGNWQFPHDSILILLYPQEYFFGATMVFLGLYCLVLLVVVKLEIVREHADNIRSQRMNGSL